jgi:DNA-binding NarL/FixJ family response regulator
MRSDVIRVVLADDHVVVRAGLKTVLKTAPDIEVVGEAKNGREAVELVVRLKPDVLVTDLSMGDMDGEAATREIVAQGLSTKILVLTMHPEEEFLLPLIEAGAAGYLMKTAVDRELIDAVRAVAYGDGYLRPSGVRILSKGISGKKHDPIQAERDRFETLTAREQDVFRLIAQGYSAPEAGDKLHISPKTVDTYKQRIHEKLGVSHRAEYIQFALKLGLLVTE